MVVVQWKRLLEALNVSCMAVVKFARRGDTRADL